MIRRQCVLAVVERLTLTIWVGGLLAVGYLVAPILFASLDERRLAGELAGKMFAAMNFVGIAAVVVLVVCGCLVAGKAWLKSRRAWALLSMLLLVLASMFVIQPMMQELKSLGLLPGSEAAQRFGQLHGVSSILYMILTVLGLYLASGTTRSHTS